MTIIYNLGIIYNFKLNCNANRFNIRLAPLVFRSRQKSGGRARDGHRVWSRDAGNARTLPRRYGYRLSQVYISIYFDKLMLAGEE